MENNKPSPNIYEEELLQDDQVAQADGLTPQEITPVVSNEAIDLDVSRCLRCVVERHPSDYVNTAMASVVVGQCLEMNYHRAGASLKRLSYADQPPVSRQRRGLPFRLTADADQLRSSGTPINCQKIGPDSVHERIESHKPRQPQLTQQEKVIWECVKDIPDPEAQEQATKKLQLLIDRNILSLKRTRVTEAPTVHGYPNGGSWVHLGIGNTLKYETEPMQKTVMRYFGVDHLVYEKPVDPAELRKELCLLPLDDLRALAQLTLYKLDRAKNRQASKR